MYIPKIIRIFTAVLFLVLCIGISSIAEEITLTTYYPAPYGAYTQLVAESFGVGDNDGSGVIDGSDAPSTQGDVWIAGNVGIGTNSPNHKVHISADRPNVSATGM